MRRTEEEMRYLKTDSYRVATSWQFYAGILMAAFASLISGWGYFGGSVVNGFHYMSWRSTYTLVYAFAAVPFAGAFIEDEVHKFGSLSVLRGSLKKYVWSKVLVCFVSSVLVVGLGVLLCCYLVHIQLPWNNLEAERRAGYEAYTCFGFLMKWDWMPAYFFCYAALRGFLAGILSVLSQWLSLYARNQLFAVALPMSAYYFLINYLPEPLNIYDIFDGAVNMVDSVALKIPIALLFSGVCVLLLEYLIEKKLSREILGREKRTK